MSDKGYFEIDKLKGKTKNRIYRVGVELEGAWEKTPKFKYGEKIDHDGSVKIEPIPIPPPPTAEAPPEEPLTDRIFRIRRAVEMYNDGMRAENRVGLVDVTDNQPRFSDFRGRVFSVGTSREILVRLESFTGASLGSGRQFVSSQKFKQLQVGEIASPVLEVTKWEEWMRNCYPNHVNKTCGLHVHMSFRKSLHYERLMVPEYQGTILNYLTKWAVELKLDKKHPIWDRLSGKNEFCKHEFMPDQQAKRSSKVYDRHGGGNRYTVINFCHGQHGTIECRVLPMFEKVDDAVDAVKQVIDITNACLRIEPKKGETLSARSIEESVDRVVRREFI